MFVHPALAAIDQARRDVRVTVRDLALTSGIDRMKLTAALNGITEEEMRNLRRACRTLHVRVPRVG